MTTILPALTPSELERCFTIRHAVFCTERGVSPAIERDDWDVLAPGCDHFLIQTDGADVGALRCRYLEDTAILQRFCVLKGHRKSGHARAALTQLEDLCRAAGMGRMELDAKFEVQGFYEKCGYAKISAPFEEAGIPHVKMMKPLI